MRRATSSLTLASTLLASSALAHPVTVDGDPSDWIARAPATANLAIVARDGAQRGALVWLDAPGDARTDLGDPSQVDLRAFAVTADATNLYLRVDIAGSLATIDPAQAPQVQIAIDLDRVSGSGERFFGAFADTTVADDARWERLVRTRMAGLEPSIVVLDDSFGVVGAGTIAIRSSASGSTIEVSVPWTALGRAGPAPAMRLTVTTYRENTENGLTVDVGGSSVSNALDVVSNGGAPVPSGFPNSWPQELSDGDVDHWLEVWLGPTGEVYAPLAVTRVVQSATQVEWVEVRNQTSETLDLAAYRVGDEETPRDPMAPAEGMFFFPPGTTLAPGGTFIAARQGTPFFTAYGRRPNGEFVVSDAMTPDMVRDTAWAFGGGTFDLASFDHALVLGPHHTILDLVHWGTSLSYPGIGSLSEAPTDRVAYRDPDTLDTDDGANDFRIVSDCRASAPCTGACRSCVRLACIPTPAGGACEDGDLCTSGETCSEAGVCSGGAAIACDDANTCTTDVCAPATGCVFTPTPAAPCDDGNSCTTGDACTATGTCEGTALDCDDANPCTADACDALLGCANTPTPGVSCADADPCDGAETCSAAGECLPGAPLDCDDGDPCTVDACLAASGCTYAADEGASCDDGDPCTTGDACAADATCAGVPDRACEPDGGVPTADAGVDAGGTELPDAGPRDASTDPRDGGVDGGTDPMAAGCSCRAIGARRARGPLWLALALGALVLARRRLQSPRMTASPSR
ncbi:MAG: lamin tail domain-containing protein [Sandaracinaceae bacterium]|nr:lamin tail domain-containing protein [Sandaracinaceae bacterium]